MRASPQPGLGPGLEGVGRKRGAERSRLLGAPRHEGPRAARAGIKLRLRLAGRWIEPRKLRLRAQRSRLRAWPGRCSRLAQICDWIFSARRERCSLCGPRESRRRPGRTALINHRRESVGNLPIGPRHAKGRTGRRNPARRLRRNSIPGKNRVRRSGHGPPRPRTLVFSHRLSSYFPPHAAATSGRHT